MVTFSRPLAWGNSRWDSYKTQSTVFSFGGSGEGVQQAFFFFFFLNWKSHHCYLKSYFCLFICLILILLSYLCWVLGIIIPLKWTDSKICGNQICDDLIKNWPFIVMLCIPSEPQVFILSLCQLNNWLTASNYPKSPEKDKSNLPTWTMLNGFTKVF